MSDTLFDLRFRCQYCHEPIQFIRSKKDSIPCEITEKVIVLRTGEVVRGFESHFAYCPGADQARRDAKK